MPTVDEITNWTSVVDTIADIFEDHRRAGGGGDPREAAEKVLAALIGSDDEPGPLDRYELRIIDAGGKPVIVWHCPRRHHGAGNGHVGIVARNAELDQTGYTVGEIIESVVGHDADHEGEEA